MAAPHPEQELGRLRKALGQGLGPVTIVCGSNALLRREAFDLLLAAVPADSELRTVDGAPLAVRGGGAAADDAADDDGDAAADAAAGDAAADDAPAAPSCPELQDLLGGGLFTRSSYLAVRRGDKWLKLFGESLAAVLPRIAPGCGLLLEAEKLDKRTRLTKALLAAGALFEFRDLYPTPFGRPDDLLGGELVQWIGQRGRGLGVPLQPEAALLVLQEVGKEPGDLLAELERLRDQVPAAERKRPLGPDQLRGRLTASAESNPFELAEAVLAGDRTRALRSVRALFERGVRGRDGRAMDLGGVFPFATSWLFQSLANVLEGRQLLEEGVSERDLPGRCGVRSFQERFVAQVRRNDAAALRRGILLLLECQRALRTTGEEPDALLERFVLGWFDGRAALLPGAATW